MKKREPEPITRQAWTAALRVEFGVVFAGSDLQTSKVLKREGSFKLGILLLEIPD